MFIGCTRSPWPLFSTRLQLGQLRVSEETEDERIRTASRVYYYPIRFAILLTNNDRSRKPFSDWSDGANQSERTDGYHSLMVAVTVTSQSEWTLQIQLATWPTFWRPWPRNCAGLSVLPDWDRSRDCIPVTRIGPTDYVRAFFVKDCLLTGT